MKPRSFPARRAASNGAADETAEARALQLAFAALAGSSRILCYGLSPQEAPQRVEGSLVALRGSERWSAYLRNRRRLDDGRSTFLIALRRLGVEERLLAIDWGTAYANAFLLVEPLDDRFDLTSPPRSNPSGSKEERDLAAQVRQEAQKVSWGASPETLLCHLRTAYGRWVYWTSTPATGDSCSYQDLPLCESQGTLRDELREALRRAYPPAQIRGQLVRLLHDESELFAGRTVECARSPFLTRLGLAVVSDPSLLTDALRGLVNEGRVAAHAPDGLYHLSGPDAPVPESMPNELFERMLL